MMRAFILLLTLLITSCSVTRRASADHQLSMTDRSQINTSLLIDTSRLKENTSRKVQKTDSAAVALTIEREYDTDKPVSPITGKPPLKKETITASSSQVKKLLQADTAALIADNNISHLQDSSRLDQATQVKDTVTTTQKKKPPWEIWLIVIIILTAAGYGLKRKFL